VIETIYRQSGMESLAAEKLSDGSTAIVDGRSNSVHSLNPTATLVWEACAKGATFARIQAAVESQTGGPVDPEIVRHALTQLERVNLIESAGGFPVESVDLGRRSMLQHVGAAGAIAIPVVLTLTAAEQKAYAFQSQSTTRAPAG
jgi:Coenzyme PQQ synthesis protein D (PqqD)